MEGIQRDIPFDLQIRVVRICHHKSKLIFITSREFKFIKLTWWKQPEKSKVKNFSLYFSGHATMCHGGKDGRKICRYNKRYKYTVGELGCMLTKETYQASNAIVQPLTAFSRSGTCPFAGMTLSRFPLEAGCNSMWGLAVCTGNMY